MSLTILLELKSHVVLKNKVPFQNNHLNLPKLQILKMTLTVWQVSLPEIELKNEYDHEPQLSDSILLPDSIMTRCLHLISIFFPSQHWTLCQFIMKLNRPSLMIIFIELDQFHTFESLIDKLASSHFYEIELNEKCDLNSQICDPVQIPESILTPVLLPDLSNILESVLIPTPVILELE